MPSVTAVQMREIDRLGTETAGLRLLQMMEHAGRSLAALVIDKLGQGWRRANVLVLAGSGGNGGGGVCAARHLANRDVAVALMLSHPDRLRPVTAHQHQIFQCAGGRNLTADRLADFRPDLIVDALIGYSLLGAPRGGPAHLIDWANSSGRPILALDVPSGLDASTGDAPGLVIRPSLTMTLALPKTGLRPAVSGEVVLADLGIPGAVFRRAGLSYRSPFGRRFTVALRWNERVAAHDGIRTKDAR